MRVFSCVPTSEVTAASAHRGSRGWVLLLGAPASPGAPAWGHLEHPLSLCRCLWDTLPVFSDLQVLLCFALFFPLTHIPTVLLANRTPVLFSQCCIFSYLYLCAFLINQVLSVSVLV